MKSNFEDEIKNIVFKLHHMELDAIPSDEILEKQYNLSDGFYHKMDKLVRKVERKKKIGNVIKYATTAAALVLIIWGLMNPSVILNAYEAVISWFEDHTIFQFKEDVGDVVVPEYELTYVTDGYELEKEVRNKYSGALIYKKGENLLTVSYGISDGTISASNEGKKYEVVKLDNGTIVHYFEGLTNQMESTMIWLSEDEKIVFSLIGEESKEELLKIREGVGQK